MPLTDDRYIHFYPAACWIRAVGGTAIALDPNTMGLEPQYTTLTTQGIVTTYEKDIVDRILFNTSNQVFQAALNTAMLGAAVTTGMETGATAGWGYDGTFNSAYFEVRISLKGTDLDAGTDAFFDILIHKLQPKQYNPAATITAKQVVGQNAQFTVFATTTDIDGDAIVPLRNSATGDYYAILKRSSAWAPA